MQHKISSMLASSWCFYGIVLLLVLQAGWIALTARYPQAFDEQYHFGIILLYAHQWSPFFLHQPAGANQLGALPGNTSFLYQYVLSFPYRLIALAIKSQDDQIIILRFINITLFASSLFIFRQLLSRSPASKALVNTTLLFFVLIPVVPLLASQINYDNLFIPLVGLGLLWTVMTIDLWRKSGELPLQLALQTVLIGLFACCVKYAYLPILAASGVTLVILAWKSRNGLLLSLRHQFIRTRLVVLAVYMLLSILAVTLWGGSYIRNIVAYHTPLPTCDAVIGAKACASYGPWLRNQQDANMLQKRPNPISSILSYDRIWISQSMTELVFAVSSNFEADGTTVDYYTVDPLPVIKAVAWIVLLSGTVVMVIFAKRLWQYAFFKVSLLTVLLYVVGLWIDNYRGFLATGQPVAVHGRYLLPLLPVILLAIGLCYSWVLHSPALTKHKYLSGTAWPVVLAMVLVLQGGGITTFIVRSDTSWFWDNDTKATKANRVAKKILKPVIIGD